MTHQMTPVELGPFDGKIRGGEEIAPRPQPLASPATGRLEEVEVSPMASTLPSSADSGNTQDPSQYVDSRNYTTGNFRLEKDAEAVFDNLIDPRLWRMYREVEGVPINIGTKGYRIDRVLLPTKAAREMGCQLGPIGVECKKSNVAIGPPISQILDYTNAVWQIDHVRLMLNWIFLFPAKRPSGPLESVLAQNRIGTVDVNWRHDGLCFYSGGQIAVETFSDKPPRFPAHTMNQGKKVGSR